MSVHQCARSTTSLEIVNLQRRRCFLARSIKMFPRKLFVMQLVQYITDYIESGLEVILTVDKNEQMVKGKFDRELQNLGLVEAFRNKFKSTGPVSYFRGQH